MRDAKYHKVSKERKYSILRAAENLAFESIRKENILDGKKCPWKEKTGISGDNKSTDKNKEEKCNECCIQRKQLDYMAE